MPARGRGARSASPDPSPADGSPRIDFDEIGRPAIERHVKRPVGIAARLDLRLVIAGDETRRLDRGAARSCARRIPARPRRVRAGNRAASRARSRCSASPSMPRARVFGGVAAISRAPARNAAKRRGVIVLAPAGNVGKGNRSRIGAPASCLRAARRRCVGPCGHRRCAPRSDGLGGDELPVRIARARRRAQRSRRRGSSAPRSDRPPRPFRPCRACS